MWKSAIFSALLLGFLVDGSSSFSFRFTCPAEDGPYGKPGECSGEYYLCFGGVAYPQNCPGNFVFDPALGRCVALGEASCRDLTTPPGGTTTTSSTTTSTTTTTTPVSTTTSSSTATPITTTSGSGTTPDIFRCPQPNGFFPIPGTCGRDYFACVSGSPYVQTCPVGSVFDPVTLICTKEELASCYYKCPSTNGNFPIDPTVCSNNFYICVDGKPYENRCPGNSLFDPTLLICVDQNSCRPATSGTNPVTNPTTTTSTTTTTTPSTTTASTTTTSGPGFTCPSSGNFEYAKCSSLYYLCYGGPGGSYAVAQCPPGEIFDPSEQFCRNPALVPGCNQQTVFQYYLESKLVNVTDAAENENARLKQLYPLF